jgi:hypothetical protein
MADGALALGGHIMEGVAGLHEHKKRLSKDDPAIEMQLNDIMATANSRIKVDGHEVRTIELDPERHHLVTIAFELFATGEYTLKGLQAKLTEAGLTNTANTALACWTGVSAQAGCAAARPLLPRRHRV